MDYVILANRIAPEMNGLPSVSMIGVLVKLAVVGVVIFAVYLWCTREKTKK